MYISSLSEAAWLSVRGSNAGPKYADETLNSKNALTIVPSFSPSMSIISVKDSKAPPLRPVTTNLFMGTSSATLVLNSISRFPTRPLSDLAWPTTARPGGSTTMLRRSG